MLGKPGELEIVPEEADAVREIFDRAGRGIPPRVIVGDLNRRGVKGPRGGKWNASTLNGSRVRGNGILSNRLSIGEIVWNRQSFIKDPDTGKRVSRPNAEDERMVSKAPHLRIVGDEQWNAINRTPRKERAPAQRTGRTMLSCLLKCHRCGGSYAVCGGDPRKGRRIVCSAMKKSSTCDNRRSWLLPKVERKVIDQLRAFLAAPEAIAAFIDEYTKQHNAAVALSSSRRNELLAEHDGLAKKIRRYLTMIGDGIGGREMAIEILGMERRQDEIQAELQREPMPAPSIHPGAVAVMSARLSSVHEALRVATGDERFEIRGDSLPRHSGNHRSRRDGAGIFGLDRGRFGAHPPGLGSPAPGG